MRKVIELIKSGLLVLLYILLGVGFLGQLLPNTAAAAENQKVRVGYFYLPGYHEMDGRGRLYGYGYDLLQKLQLYNNWSCEYVGYDEKWNDGFKMLERGEIDLITGVRKRSERLAKFSYSRNPVGRSSSVLVVREEDDRYTSGNYSTYQNMRVGALRGSIVNINFDSFTKEKGFAYTIRYY